MWIIQILYEPHTEVKYQVLSWCFLLSVISKYIYIYIEAFFLLGLYLPCQSCLRLPHFCAKLRPIALPSLCSVTAVTAGMILTCLVIIKREGRWGDEEIGRQVRARSKAQYRSRQRLLDKSLFRAERRDSFSLQSQPEYNQGRPLREIHYAGVTW